jgi:Holliday junction DNA helicase RuvA
MIGYLRGTVYQIQVINNNRNLLMLEVNGIGYELQISQRMAKELILESETQVFTHQHVREDAILLYGFGNVAERDLFRQLTSVSGVGAALAIALLDKLGSIDLVQAIVAGNIQLLATTPGVGKKTAERLALELRTKLGEDRAAAGLGELPPIGNLDRQLQAEVEMTLLALGYSNTEIAKALQSIAQDGAIAKSPHVEDWLRLAIASM